MELEIIFLFILTAVGFTAFGYIIRELIDPNAK